MAVPGFSVHDVIKALGQAKQVYDAFFDKYKNTASQVKQLADDIEEFRKDLQTHKVMIEKHGVEYTGYEAVTRTLEECCAFVDKYKSALDRRFTASGAFRTTKFAFVQDDVKRLREQIASHRNHMVFQSVSIVLENSPRRESTVEASLRTSQSLPIQNQSLVTFIPPTSPSITPQSPPESFLSASPEAVFTTGNLSPSTRPLQSSNQGSPRSSIPSPEIDTEPHQRRSTLDSLVLPQPALSYPVAKVCFGSKFIELKRKPIGRNFAGGRELVIIDELGKLRLAHRITSPSNQPLFPFTWHRKWKDHDPLEVTFKGIPSECHSIVFKGQPIGPGIPRYVFKSHEDYMDFQSQVRGKTLLFSVDLRHVRTATSAKNGEATDQVLKIWKDTFSQERSISFYANAIENPHDMEFPIFMFNQHLKLSEQSIELEFAASTEPKRRFTRPFSRTPTERSTSSTSSTAFSRTQSGMTSTTIPTTIADSRMSVVSSSSECGGRERQRDTSTLESRAKQMRYLSIEFSNMDECSKFRHELGTAFKNGSLRPIDFFLDWKLEAGTKAEPGTAELNENLV